MTSRFRKVITGAALVAVLALGGAGVASALSTGSGDPATPAVAPDTSPDADDQGAGDTAAAEDAPSGGDTSPGREDCLEGAGGQGRAQNGSQGGATDDTDV
jgi:hypothetical protein